MELGEILSVAMTFLLGPRIQQKSMDSGSGELLAAEKPSVRATRYLQRQLRAVIARAPELQPLREAPPPRTPPHVAPCALAAVAGHSLDNPCPAGRGCPLHPKALQSAKQDDDEDDDGEDEEEGAEAKEILRARFLLPSFRLLVLTLPEEDVVSFVSTVLAWLAGRVRRLPAFTRTSEARKGTVMVRKGEDAGLLSFTSPLMRVFESFLNDIQPDAAWGRVRVSTAPGHEARVFFGSVVTRLCSGCERWNTQLGISHANPCQSLFPSVSEQRTTRRRRQRPNLSAYVSSRRRLYPSAQHLRWRRSKPYRHSIALQSRYYIVKTRMINGCVILVSSAVQPNPDTLDLLAAKNRDILKLKEQIATLTNLNDNTGAISPPSSALLVHHALRLRIRLHLWQRVTQKHHNDSVQQK